MNRAEQDRVQPMISDTRKALHTARLSLHTVSDSDAPDIQRAAAAREIADSMISIPHPYPPGEARRYIAREKAAQESGQALSFAIRKRSDNDFLGIIELRAIEQEHSQGELSFWLTQDAWGKGYMPEALAEVIRFGFAEIKLNRLYAYHMLRNPASGIILERTGFSREGLLRQRVRKWGVYEDVALWAILYRDWLSAEARTCVPPA